MNYPQALNEFWRRVKLKDVEMTPFQGFMYFALLHLANENRWQSNVVSVSNTELMRLSLITHKSTFIKTRLALIKKKLIKFEAGKTDHTYSKYTLNFTGTNPNPVEEKTGTPTGTLTMAPTGTLTGSGTNPALPIYDLNKRNENKSLPRRVLKLDFLKNKKTAGEEQQ